MKISPADKNNLYHTILQAIKTASPQQASGEIVMLFEQFMTDKENEAFETTEEDGQISADKAKMTGPFRRAGS